MADPIFPTPNAALAPVAAAITAARPKAAAFLQSGRYGNVLRGWMAQKALLRRRAADEACQARLPTADVTTGLPELVQSEFFVTIPQVPRAAIGTVYIQRLWPSTSPTPVSNFPIGVIQAGKKFHRAANANHLPAWTDANYISTKTVFCGPNEDTSQPAAPSPVPPGWVYPHVQTIAVRIQAIQSGPASNTMSDDPQNSPFDGGIALADTLFDMGDDTVGPTVNGRVVAVTGSDCAGGTLGNTSADLITLAQFASLGRFGANKFALMLGAMTDAGVRHVAYSEDMINGISVLFIADESWACSGELIKEVRQVVSSSWEGFGLRFDVRPISLVLVNAAASIVLTDQKYLADEADLSNVASAALRQYFETKTDIWAWATNSIAATLAGCDGRILTVPLAGMPVITKAKTGAVITQPTQAISQPPTPFLIHYSLATAGGQFTFLPPVGA